MKKIIVLSFFVAALILFGMNVSSSVRYSNTREAPIESRIHYQVDIHADWTIVNNQCPMWVTITDGTVPPLFKQSQFYHAGKNTYHFYENGPVSGLRVAQLTTAYSDNQPGDVCYNVLLVDSKNGTFYNDMNYIYDLFGPGINNIRQDNSRPKE